ncbi:hypothetical protein OEZ85_013022 [Tetradesmus obliquus]|uniref:Alpha-1,3-glucosyltransferase n=1 Tax=Tetradesmus obliquus TaxID=3088 RepID=A0ABY8U9J8_TETOB|nr:hypothetical protein OEZ85_013022 [Tetradesmus obliquus]
MLAHPNTYRSTDFEVHRNWLAITYQLPISKWFYEATSEWTLDYPPLFAWFEWAMAQAARFVDPKMLSVSNLEYDSPATVLFQRLSVSVTGLVLVAAMLHATQRSRESPAGLTAFFLAVCNAGLIMVDNIHFQYNGVLLGLLLWSILMLEEQRYVLAGALFALLLNMKHLFAYLGPAYFVFLLRHYVLDGSSSSSSSGSSSSGSSSGGCAGMLRRLVLLGGVVVAICGVSFGPFVALGQMGQVLSRLFPFARGLCHAYWAPNAWALYSFADKLAAAATAAAGLRQPSAMPAANMAGGVVGVSSYVVLPNIGAGMCAALTLLAILPCLVALWKAPKAQAGPMFAAAAAYANLCGFMFGYHVHEKAALTVLLPMVLPAVRDAGWGRQFVLLSTAAHTVHAWPFNPPFTFPANGTVKHMLVIQTKPLARAPTRPPLYRGRANWTFVGGPGTLMVASYSKAPDPIGPYNELVYIPGQYAPCAKSSITYDSVTRIWVDNRPSLEVGRYIGGMPKYMASFRWQLDPVTGAPVNVTVRATNRTILRIVGLKPSSSAASAATAAGADGEAETAASVQYVFSRSNVQWPIYPPNAQKPEKDVPLVSSQQFDTGDKKIALLKADSIFLDALTFTGNASMPAVYDSGRSIISAPNGTIGTVNQHKNLTCP